jgi:hypothetical protein
MVGTPRRRGMVETRQVTIEDICSQEVFNQAWLQIHKGLDREGLVLDVVLNMDYEADLEANLSRLLRRLSGHTYHPCPCREVPSAKGKGLTRPVVVLDIEDAIVCQAIAWRLAPVLDSKLTPSVYSMRATQYKKKPFEDWYDEWPKYQKRIRGMLANSDDSCLVVTDITAFFDNLDLRILKALLLDAGVSLEVSDLLTFMIESWVYRPPYGVPMGRGIPQADWDLPRALDNFYLHPHDARVRAECGDSYARWVDDMNAVVGSKVRGKKLIGVLNQSLRRLFLSANAGKTEVLSGIKDISAYFWFDENDFLDEMEKKIRQATKGEVARAPVLHQLKRRYAGFRNSKRLGNWEKVLKR